MPKGIFAQTVVNEMNRIQSRRTKRCGTAIHASYIIIVITNNCTFNVTKVYVTRVYIYISDTPICFDIFMSSSGISNSALCQVTLILIFQPLILRKNNKNINING